MILFALAMLAPQPAPALPAVDVCTPVMPAGLEGWPDAHPLAHGFVVGRAVDLPAVPVANVRLAVQPSKPLSGTHLASAGFEVTTAGRYAVAVGSARSAPKPLWLDIAGADGKPLTAVGHGHGPACSSITKIVDFDLTPGRYTLLVTELTGGDQPVRALIVKKAAQQ